MKSVEESRFRIGIGGDRTEKEPRDIPEYVYEAYCSSGQCISKRYKLKFADTVDKLLAGGVKKKNAKKRDVFCPDCGFALYWKRREV